MNADERESGADWLKSAHVFGCTPFSLTCIYPRPFAFICG
jgi:hypothetical protein